MFRLSLSILVVLLTGHGAVADDTREQLAKLSDKALVDEYRSTMPAPFGNGRFGWPSSAFSPNPVRAEVLRRGRVMVPELLALFRAEAIADRPADSLSGFNNPFRDITEILAAIGDPRVVPDLMELLEDKKQQVNSLFRHNALYCIEQLSFCAMRRVDPYERLASLTVPHPTAIQATRFDELGKAARLYRTWLAGEGKDPAQWLSLARQRAMKRLGGDEPDAIFMSAEFLFSHDGDRRLLIAALAKVTGELKPGPKPDSWTYCGQPSTMTIASWVRLLTRYGRDARPHAALLIRIQKEQGDNTEFFYARLREVGGTEVMDQLVEVLPRISAEVAAIKADPKTPKGFDNKDPRGLWFGSLREVQLALDRWAGRRFSTDDDRVAWWKANRGRQRPQWLAENLDVVVQQADAKDPWAEWVVREVLPDVPRPVPVQKSGTKTFAGWLVENRSKLKYDPNTEAFRLKPKEVGR